MNLQLPTSQTWSDRCQQDAEFQLASRHWTGSFALNTGDTSLKISFTDGNATATSSGPETSFTGTEEVWQKVLSAIPERFNNDLMANVMQGAGLQRQCEPVHFAQYFPAMARAVELLRPSTEQGDAMPHDLNEDGAFSAAVGRYVHLTLGGLKHRIYFEEAGQGIPILMQHTAGCHSSQWRHLLEMPEITSRFRLIAYDLPYHGKSLPPVEHNWWEQQYLLKGEYLRSVPLQLSQALGLDRPVFMGCSVGGLLALDLAHKHAENFRSVISLEGALEIPGKLKHNSELWHPQVSNEYKARLMDALMSPTSPKRYRKETSFVYASGWPQIFHGDLQYYLEEFDLRNTAHEIDTTRVGVHILSGEYDCSGTRELGEAAHKAIAGSTYSEMKAVGHFPMSENPRQFIKYLMPVLDEIENHPCS
ncbi:MAG: pimeloyl-ACP methyl ester carboxylesterase [Candidatus Azotimanducaceae bacterium]|jgi:pimeloyl-ACP methyl ester carboxylesterase